SGFGAGMAHFIAVVSHKGPFPDDFAEQPGPDPAMFGMPAGDDGSRADVLLGQNMVTCTHYEPDFDALRKASTRIVIAVGEESDGEMAHRGGEAGAERPRSGGSAAAKSSPSGSASRPCRSRATMADSSGASTARPASPTSSPRSSATC